MQLKKNNRNLAIVLFKTSWLLGYAFCGPAVWTWPVFNCSGIIVTAAKNYSY